MNMDDFIKNLEEEISSNPSIRAMEWWDKIMSPDYPDAKVVRAAVHDVCRRNPEVIFALKKAIVRELDSMLNGEEQPDITFDEKFNTK